MDEDPIVVLEELRALLAGRPSAERLREIRIIVQDGAFRRELVRVYRQINDPDMARELRMLVLAVLNLARDKQRQLAFRQRLVMAVGVAGGSAFVVGVGTSIFTLGLSSVAGVVIGGAVAARSAQAAEKLDELAHLHDDIGTHIQRTVDAIDHVDDERAH